MWCIDARRTSCSGVENQDWELCRALRKRPSQSAIPSSTPGLKNDAKCMLRAEAQDVRKMEELHHIQAARSGLHGRQALLRPAHSACKLGLVLTGSLADAPELVDNAAVLS